jgi:hypothetical protein
MRLAENVFAYDQMAVGSEYRIWAARLRSQAERQEDPLFRAMLSSPPITGGALTRRLYGLELNRRCDEQKPQHDANHRRAKLPHAISITGPQASDFEEADFDAV